MRAREFIREARLVLEVSPADIARTPAKGGATVGELAAKKLGAETGQELDPVKAIELISAADPTPQNKMTKWLTRIYLSGDSNMRLPEDAEQIKTDLTKFMKLGQAKKLQPGQNNLDAFKTLGELYDVLEKFSDEDATSNREQDKQTKMEGIDTIINEPGLKIYHTKTHEANCLVGAGTKWCTASKDDSNYFDQYSKDGPLYAIIEGEGANQKKYQFHYESDQFLNARDEEVDDSDIAALSQHPGWAKFLNAQIKEHYGKYFEDAETA